MIIHDAVPDEGECEPELDEEDNQLPNDDDEDDDPDLPTDPYLHYLEKQLAVTHGDKDHS